MKTILFVPTYWHSSIELFSNIIKRLDGNIKKVLLETDDPHYKNFIDRKSIKDTVDIYFDQMVFLRFPSTLKKTIKSK